MTAGAFPGATNGCPRTRRTEEASDARCPCDRSPKTEAPWVVRLCRQCLGMVRRPLCGRPAERARGGVERAPPAAAVRGPERVAPGCPVLEPRVPRGSDCDDLHPLDSVDAVAERVPLRPLRLRAPSDIRRAAGNRMTAGRPRGPDELEATPGMRQGRAEKPRPVLLSVDLHVDPRDALPSPSQA